MTKTDTDSEMMRDQQDRDTPQHMARDGEKHPAERSDLDAQSKAEREQAKDGTAPNGTEQMEAIFEANQKGPKSEKAESDLMADAATDGQAGLARPNRSLLGD
ncbi:hypothetical protein [Aurantimonas manganoxydans]|uniref:Uncharacterized protein n=1 Tax=Aurantimonas manganoxydans TaxID=651183 RepID=A0A0P0Z539_9HYPH|nr:hypothetical protein [Aurantimonas manganoxydans]BAT29176.1 hypothetical protein [Aurantimonas manganoxydans SI85-9A1]